MNDVAIEALMHDVLDGTATAEDQARLQQRLAADPALRERFTVLQDLFETLNRVPMVEPPAGMHAELMQSIQSEAGRTRTPGWMAALADAFRARPVPAFAMTTITVGALALLLWSAADRRDTLVAGGESPVTGTMAPPATPRAALLESGDARIRIELGREGGSLLATVSGEAPSGATLAIGFGPGVPTLRGAGAELLDSGVEPGRVGLRLSGHVDAALRFDAPVRVTGDVDVSLVTADGVVEREVSTGPGGNGP
jgi:anti-sigma factor RsiW